MKSILLPLALVTAPLAAQETASEAPVSYDDAVGCAFVALAVGLSENPDPEVGITAIELGVRYMRYAVDISGNSEDVVTDDMGVAGDAIAAEIQQSETPAEDVAARFRHCQAASDSLFPTPAAS